MWRTTLINPYDFVEELSKVLTPEHVIVCASSGSASEIMQQAFKVKKGQRVICSPGLGSMGFTLPHAIGVSYASDRPVVAVCGDGDLQHNIQELQGMYNRNIKLFVWNNGGYNSIKNTQNRYFEGRQYGCADSLPDLSSLASAYSIDYYRYEGLYHHGILNLMGSVIISVDIDPDIKTGPRIVNKIVDGKFVSGRLEDVE